MNWIRAINELTGKNEPFVVITVIEISGSAPREVGARMVVTEDTEFDSIGGGNMEYLAIGEARQMLQRVDAPMRNVEYVGLGVTLSQCCGGAVRLMYEKFAGANTHHLSGISDSHESRQVNFVLSPVTGSEPSMLLSVKSKWRQWPRMVSDAAQQMLQAAEPRSLLLFDGSNEWFLTRVDQYPTKLVLFGAGHVGKALVHLLQNLPFQVDWVDERQEVFPTSSPANVNPIHQLDPLEVLDGQPDDVFYVVMTHSHGRDYELCLEILRRRKFGWLGLIGSETKRARFEQRFVQDGIDSFTLKRLHCPIGIKSIRGKFPAVIAVSTVAQLLKFRQRQLVDVSGGDSIYEDANEISSLSG